MTGNQQQPATLSTAIRMRLLRYKTKSDWVMERWEPIKLLAENTRALLSKMATATLEYVPSDDTSSAKPFVG